MANSIIQPRVLKGFRDTLPRECMMKREMIRIIEASFSLYGFTPIDTPALEYAEILLGKGSEETDRQLFRFTDNGKRDVALRFDLTVPLARYIASNQASLATPFKRYQIAPVWRAEKPQRGRYREFIQCDIDILGTTAAVADAEILVAVSRCLDNLGAKHRFLINHRKLLSGFMEQIGALPQAEDILRIMDKLGKLGREKVEQELSALVSSSQINDIFSFLELSQLECPQSDNGISDSKQTVADFKKTLARAEEFLEAKPGSLSDIGIQETRRFAELVNAHGISEEILQLDLSIARGLDYYTGIVFETQLLDLPEIGSICSGGRYDDLTSLYTKTKFPGVGCSIGLDRLLAAYDELKRIPKADSTASVLVTVFSQELLPQSIQLAEKLRSCGINVELYGESGKLGSQLKYANRRGIPLATIIGDEEAQTETCNIKMLESGEQLERVAQADAGRIIQEQLVARADKHFGPFSIHGQ